MISMNLLRYMSSNLCLLFHHFSNFLISHDFVCTLPNPFMFIVSANSHLLILILYVDKQL